MKKQSLPVYDISHFQYLGSEGSFYANKFPQHLKQHHHLILAPHRHNFYVTVLFTRGSGYHEIEFNSYKIHPGMVFTLSPGEVHSWTLSKDIDGYIFFHTREFIDLNFTNEKIENFPFFSRPGKSPVINLEKGDLKYVEALFREIVTEYHQSKLMRYQKICSLVNILYITLSRQYRPQKIITCQNHHYLARLRKLEELIEKNFREQKSAGAYSRLMNISTKHLNRICKTCLGKTTSEVIMDRIMLEAKRMLIFSNAGVAGISAELGYLDTSYFCRCFKKHTGKTPADFVKQYQRAQENQKKVLKGQKVEQSVNGNSPIMIQVTK